MNWPPRAAELQVSQRECVERSRRILTASGLLASFSSALRMVERLGAVHVLRSSVSCELRALVSVLLKLGTSFGAGFDRKTGSVQMRPR
jgi:hypothetical protein